MQFMWYACQQFHLEKNNTVYVQIYIIFVVFTVKLLSAKFSSSKFID